MTRPESQTPSAAELVKWDLRRLKAKDVATLASASRAGDVDAMASTLAKVIVECPPEWGRADDPETYLNLDYYGSFTELIEGIGVEAGKLRAP